MAAVMKKSLNTPEETRPIDKGKVEVVNLGDITVMRARFEPGWRWSESVKPIVQTKSCEVAHLIHVNTGRMRVKMDDGTETEFGPGDVGTIPPGHDAWVVGNEAFTGLDFQGGAAYAKLRT